MQVRSEFSPEDIINQRFLTTIGGYDKEEVRKFLRAIAKELQDKNELIEEYRRQAESRVASPDAEALYEALQSTRSLASELGSKLDAATKLVDELQGMAAPVAPAQDLSAAAGVDVTTPQEDVTTPHDDSPTQQDDATPPQDDPVVLPEEVEPSADDRPAEIELPSEEWEELFEDPIETKRGTLRP